MIAQEPEVKQDTRWHYVMPSSNAPHTLTGEVPCPCCNEPMEWVSGTDTYGCINDDCPFYLSDAVQAVINAMLDDVSEDCSITERIVEACEIARAYTLDEEDTTFRIKDRESAGWYMKKLAKIEAQMVDINREPDARVAELRAEIDAINERRRDMLKKPERDLLFFTTRYEPELREWFEAEIKGSKDKSIKLSYGTVGKQKTQPSNVVDVETDTIVFAEQAEELQDPESAVPFVNVKKSIYKESVFGWIAANTDHERVRVEEDGTISLLEDNPFLEEGEDPAVIAHIAPAGEKFYVKAALPGGVK